MNKLLRNLTIMAVAATAMSNLGAVGASDASRRLNPVTTADGKLR